MYGYDGDYTSKFYPCPRKVFVPFNYDAKVAIIFEITKLFPLKDVNRILKNPPCPSLGLEEISAGLIIFWLLDTIKLFVKFS